MVHKKREMSPNDPKLSDCGARRAGCGKVDGGERSEAAGAASVTRGAVRCSAWLGASVIGRIVGISDLVSNLATQATMDADEKPSRENAERNTASREENDAAL